MLRFPSLVKQYDAYASCDPAFRQPPTPPTDDSGKEAYVTALTAYVATLKAAHETGDWSALRVNGEEPTKFVLQPIDAEEFRALHDLAMLPETSPRYIGDRVAQALLVRMAFVDVPGVLELKAKRAPDEKYGWSMAQSEVIQILDSLDRRIVGDLARTISARANASPL